MKSINFLILIFLCTNLLSQDYIPMLGESNEWFVQWGFEGSWTEYSHTYDDVTINGKTYKKIGDGYNPNSSPYALIREDTIEKKVYAMHPLSEDSSETLYYDFTLQENDSILLNIDFRREAWYYVDSIREVQLLSEPSKIFYLKGDINEYGNYAYPIWIEGVGSLGDPIKHMYTPGPYFGPDLNCFFRDGEKIYQSEWSTSHGGCSVILNTSQLEESRLLIYPNPANSIINLDLPVGMHFSVDIFDIIGRPVLYIENQRQINISEVSPGIYLVFVRFEGQHLIMQLVVE